MGVTHVEGGRAIRPGKWRYLSSERTESGGTSLCVGTRIACHGHGEDVGRGRRLLLSYRRSRDTIGTVHGWSVWMWIVDCGCGLWLAGGREFWREATDSRNTEHLEANFWREDICF